MSKEAEKISDAMEYIDDGLIRETDILRSESAKSVKSKNRGQVTNIRSHWVKQFAAAAAILVIGTGAGITIHHNIMRSSEQAMTEKTLSTSDVNYKFNNVHGFAGAMNQEDGYVTDELKAIAPTSSVASISLDDPESDYMLNSFDKEFVEADRTFANDKFGGPESAFALDSPFSSTLCLVRIAVGDVDVDKNFCELSFIVDYEEEGISYLVSDDYIIEKLEGGEWREILPGETTSFITYASPVGFSIAHADEAAKIKFDWTERYGTLDSGEYRIVVKLYRKDAGGTRPFTRKIHLTQE